VSLLHQFLDARAGIGAEQVSQADDADDSSDVVQHGDRVDRLGVVEPGAHPGERLVDGQPDPGPYVLGRHAPADAALGVAEHGRSEHPIRLGQAPQQSSRERRGQLLEQPGAIVGIELGEEPRDLGIVQPCEQIALQLGVERFEDLERSLLAEQSEHHRSSPQAEAVEERNQVGGRERGQGLGQRVQVTGGELLLDGVDEPVDDGNALGGARLDGAGAGRRTAKPVRNAALREMRRAAAPPRLVGAGRRGEHVARLVTATVTGHGLTSLQVVGRGPRAPAQRARHDPQRP
jgi:hypothetical protein